MIQQLQSILGLSRACRHVGVSRSTYYRRLRPAESAKRRASGPNQLSASVRKAVVDLLNAPRYADQAVRQVWASLWDEGTYYCHWRTMYRVLAELGQTTERRNQRMHPPYRIPRPLATAPNQLWSWDITRLRGRQKWESYALYMALDVYSRFVVGWMVAPAESGVLAAEFIEGLCDQHQISPKQLTIHSDRGSAMISKTCQQKMAELGVTGSYARPYTSNDNPYSESAFKTLKYRPTYPARFGSIEDARGWVHRFVQWYNYEHYHTGLALMHPATVHFGQTEAVKAHREKVLVDTMARHPERFPRGLPKVQMPPETVWINPPIDPKIQTETCNLKPKCAK